MAVVGALTGCFAQLFTSLAFVTNPSANGPLASFITGDIIVFAIFCHFFYRDRLSLWQWLTTIVLFAGLVLIALGGQHSTDPGTYDAHHTMSFVWAVCAMLFFFQDKVAVRITHDFHVTNLGRVFVRCVVNVILGLVGLLFLKELEDSTWTDFLNELFPNSLMGSALPVLCGLAQTMGDFSLGRAFEYPRATIPCVIIGCNSLVVLVLEAVIDHALPTIEGGVGMGLTVSACILMTLLRKSAEASPLQ